MEHRQLEVIKRLAKEYNLPIRQTRYVDENYFPARCEFYKDGVSFETFKEICSTEGYDTVELVCHPALVDERLMNVSSYNMNRIKELELLKSDEFKQFIKDHDIQIITYADIKNNYVFLNNSSRNEKKVNGVTYMRYADKMNYVKKSAIRSVMAVASENGTVEYISFAEWFPVQKAIHRKS